MVYLCKSDGSHDINHKRKGSSEMMKFFHVTNCQRRGKPGKHGGCSWETALWQLKSSNWNLPRKVKTAPGLFETVWRCLGEFWCPHTKRQPGLRELPFGFLCLCRWAQSSLFPGGSDAHRLCRTGLDLWNVSVGNEQGKPKSTSTRWSNTRNKPQNNPKIILKAVTPKWFNSTPVSFKLVVLKLCNYQLDEGNMLYMDVQVFWCS